MSRLDVIILFRPSEAEVESAVALIGAMSNPGIIWDNSPEVADRDRIRRVCAEGGVEYGTKGSNLGTSGALNHLLRIAAARGIDWLHYLDQDSTPSNEYLARLSLVDGLPDDVAAVGCAYALPGDARAGTRPTEPHATATVIASGTVYRVSALLEVAGFDETMFLDTVDHEICYRLRSHGHRVFVDPGRTMGHTIGSDTFSVGNAEFSWHPAWRRRQMWRNSVWLTTRYASHFPVEMSKHWMARLGSTAVAAMKFKDPSFATQGILGLRDALLTSGERQGLPRRNHARLDKAPFLSVVIPVKNGADTIARAVQSCALDRFPELEVIVVENGSTDGTPAILRDLTHPRLQVVEMPPRGRSAARNRGIELASGAYLLFLDADDELVPDGVEDLLHVLTAERPDAAVGLVDVVSAAGDAMRISPPSTPLVDELLVLNRLPINAVALRREHCATFPEGVEHCEDWHFWLESLRGRSEPRRVPVVVGRVHRHANNTSSDLGRMKSFEIPVYLDHLDMPAPPVFAAKRATLLGLALLVYADSTPIDAIEARIAASPRARRTVRVLRDHPQLRTISKAVFRRVVPGSEAFT